MYLQRLLVRVISFWRSQGHSIIMFLDDGLGGASDLDFAGKFSTEVRKYLTQLGFLLAEQKCNWQPQNKITWLGLFWDMVVGKVYITDRRIQKIIHSIETLLVKIKRDTFISVRELAAVAGQIISAQGKVVGKVVLLKSREIFQCINNRASWESAIVVSDTALLELKFWKNQIGFLNGLDIKDVFEFQYSVYSDASVTGFGGYIVEMDGSEVLGTWSDS